MLRPRLGVETGVTRSNEGQIVARGRLAGLAMLRAPNRFGLPASPRALLRLVPTRLCPLSTLPVGTQLERESPGPPCALASHMQAPGEAALRL